MTQRYPVEVLDEDYDDGRMPENVAELASHVVGRKIIKAERSASGSRSSWYREDRLVLTLDNGKKVLLHETDDCCAYTQLESFLLHPELVDHMIMGVGTTDGYQTWHIYADAGDVLELSVGWSCGNPFYYGYGFYITVEEDKDADQRPE